MALATFPLQETINETLKRIVHIARPRQVILFGSGSTEQWTPESDLDFLVIVRGPVHRRKLAQEIYRNLHGIRVPVDVVVATEDDVQAYGDQVGSILKSALAEGKEIYHADK